MASTKNVDVNKQIICEKGNFLLNNSTFFYRNLKEKDECLKQILLNPAPLAHCPEYQDELIKEITVSKIRNNTQLSYKYSLEILFHIVNMIKSNTISTSDKNNGKIDDRIELIRAYVKYISSQFSETERTIYNSKQNIININKKQYEEVNEKIKFYKKVKR